MKISPVCEHRCRLGEGPLWDALHQRLYWADSLGPELYWLDFATDRVHRCQLPGDCVGSLAVRENGGLILAMDQGFYAFEPRFGKAEPIALPLNGQDGFRFNDGKVDPFGHFISGAMNMDHRGTETGSMYRLTPEHEVLELLDGFICFNGPCFSEDGAQLYLTGRKDGLIECFDYGPTQLPTNAVAVLDCDADGATVDSEGYLWSAQWEAGCILRLSPTGEIDTRIDIPGQIVSSVMFGGPDLDRIYVTTLGDAYYGAIPKGELPGRTLVIEGSGFHGRPEPRFKG